MGWTCPEPAGQAPFDWAEIDTIPGAVTATLLIALYPKMPPDKAWKIPTRYWVLLIDKGNEHS